MNNPWLELPSEPPFVLPADAPLLPKAMERPTDLMLDVRPEPYVGNPATARVICLLLNPGYVPEDLAVNRDPYFQQQNRRNLEHRATPSFYYLDPRLNYSGGYIWWAKKLSGLTRAGFRLDELADKLACVEYLPYHSVNYKHSRQLLPSQQYSFELVRQAVRARSSSSCAASAFGCRPSPSWPTAATSSCAIRRTPPSARAICHQPISRA
jgi:hypothetical protein